MNSLNSTLLRLTSGLLCVLALHTAQAAPVTFDVTIDTSSVASQSAYVDIQLNPAVIGIPSAQVTISMWAPQASLLAAPTLDGDATGSLASQLLILNTTSFNAYLQSVSLAAQLTFRLRFDGDYDTGASPDQTRFTFNLLDSNFAPLLLSAASTELLAFDLGFNSTQARFDDAVVTINEAPVNPAPAPWVPALLVGGMLAIVASRQRRRELKQG